LAEGGVVVDLVRLAAAAARRRTQSACAAV
jgi:hypothetical protein